MVVNKTVSVCLLLGISHSWQFPIKSIFKKMTKWLSFILFSPKLWSIEKVLLVINYMPRYHQFCWGTRLLFKLGRLWRICEHTTSEVLNADDEFITKYISQLQSETWKLSDKPVLNITLAYDREQNDTLIDWIHHIV